MEDSQFWVLFIKLKKMLDKIFPSYATMRKLEDEKVSSDTRVTDLEKALERKQEEIVRLNRSHDDELFHARRDKTRSEDEIKHNHNVKVRELELEITDLKARIESAEERADEAEEKAEEVAGLEADARVEAAERKADRRVSEVERQAAKDVANAEIRAEKAEKLAEARAEEKVKDEVNQLRSDVAMQTAETATYKAEAGQKDTVIKGLEKQVEGYEKFAQFVLTKLPNIDLNKFGITVDVPAPEVTVVGGGGGKKS